MPARRTIFRALAASALALILVSADKAPALGADWFEFSFPAELAFQGILARPFLGSAPAEGSSLARVRPSRDGHFVLPGNSRVRFVGANVQEIPPASAGSAQAGRMAAFGINLARFHHIDADWNDNVFGGIKPGRRVELSEAWLSRFDLFRAQLAKAGIWSNVNLLTGRTFSSADGLPEAVDLVDDFKTRHALGFWYRPVLELQKDYARRLLSHVSLLSGLSLAKDPTVAFVEINNENGLSHAWLSGSLDDLPAELLEPLRFSWNAWLKERYGDAATLKEKLSLSDGQETFLVEPAAQPLNSFFLERRDGAEAVLGDLYTPEGLEGVSVDVGKPRSGPYAVQLHKDLSVVEGASYRVSFLARADRPRSVFIELSMADEPWDNLGFRAEMKLDTTWRRYQFLSTPLPFSEKRARVNLAGYGAETGRVEFAALRLSSVVLGLGAVEDPAAGTMPLLRSSERGAWQEAYLGEWMAFLHATEAAYWKEMRDYIKNDLGVEAMVVGTAVGTASAGLMKDFDSVDAHAYWGHPVFPGRAWDEGNWYLRNSSVVRQSEGGSISAPAMARVWGKPFTVSEYSHPYPNQYGAEGYPLLGAYAAFQDWDGICVFDWPAAKPDGSDLHSISGYFDVASDPVRLAGLLNAAHWFRNKAVSIGREPLGQPMDGARELELLKSSGPWNLPDARAAGLRPKAALARRVGLDMGGGLILPSGIMPAASWKHPGGFIDSDTKELHWDSDAGRVTLDAPTAKMVTGFNVGKKTSFSGGLSITQGDSSLHASTIMVNVMEGALDAAPLTSKKVPASRILVTALGGVRNLSDGLRYYGGKPLDIPPADADVSCEPGMGSGPVLVQGVGAVIELPVVGRKIKAWALLPNGARGKEVKVKVSGRNAQIAIGSVYGTIFYEIEIQ